MEDSTTEQKGQLPAGATVCPHCGQKTGGLDRCEWCDSVLFNVNEPPGMKADELKAKEDVKIKAQEALRTLLSEKRSREKKQKKTTNAKNSVDIEVTAGPRLAPEIDREKFLEVYPVNDRYAYVGIEASQPPAYHVYEVSLTRGEAELIKEIRAWLYETINVDFASLEKPEEFLRQKVQAIIGDFRISLTPESLEKIMYYLVRDLIGYGRLDPVLRDKKAEDISADGPGIPVYVYHQNYGSLKTNVIFNEEELDSLINKLAQRSGRHISLARPLLDASLPSRDRLQLSIGGQVTTRGSTFTIRKFREIPFTPIDLIKLGTLSLEMAVYFWLAVENGFNILIIGGTASGKTTFLNTISMFIPPACKIVSIEDTREINLLHENWIPSITKEAEEGGAIEMFDLLRTALRQRPEYLLVGEVRGREASTLFQAMATGHITFATFHADSVESLVKRLTKPPIDVPLMLLDSIDIVAIFSLEKTGDVRNRRCTRVVEVTDVDFDKGGLKTNEVFRYAAGSFQFSSESRVFVKAMEKMNLSEADFAAEFSRRMRVIKRLCESRDIDFYILSQLLFDYSRHPDEVEKSLLQGETA